MDRSRVLKTFPLLLTKKYSSWQITCYPLLFLISEHFSIHFGIFNEYFTYKTHIFIFLHHFSSIYEKCAMFCSILTVKYNHIGLEIFTGSFTISKSHQYFNIFHSNIQSIFWLITFIPLQILNILFPTFPYFIFIPNNFISFILNSTDSAGDSLFSSFHPLQITFSFVSKLLCIFLFFFLNNHTPMKKPMYILLSHALVMSCLGYHNALYLWLPLKSIQKLQLLQKAATWVILGAQRRAHVKTFALQTTSGSSLLPDLIHSVDCDL